jgi:hypothetical protein
MIRTKITRKTTDYVMLAMLVGCALCREELATGRTDQSLMLSLTFPDFETARSNLPF